MIRDTHRQAVYRAECAAFKPRRGARFVTVLAPRERVLRIDSVRALFGPRRREIRLSDAIHDLGIRILRARAQVRALETSTR